MKSSDLVSVTKQSFQEWLEDRAPNEAAALAYYTMISVPALLLLIQWILGQVVSEQVQAQAIDFVEKAVRGGGGDALAAIIENADSPGSGGGIAAIASLATLVLSATGVVIHLEQSLNRMWEIAEEDSGIVNKIRERLSSLLAVLVLGLFLLASVSLSTAVSAFSQSFAASLPAGEWVLQGVNLLLSVLVLTLLFGVTLKIIPDAEVAWRDVWLGSAVTAVLFVLGQFVLSLYLGKSAPGSAYGPAGSIVAFVVWVYYSALILFLGAEFTQVYANRFGSQVRPDASAIPLQEQIMREQAQPWVEPADDAEEPGREAPPQHRSEEREPGAGSPTPAFAAAIHHVSRQEQNRRRQSRTHYFLVGFLALALGAWRWLRGRGGEEVSA